MTGSGVDVDVSGLLGRLIGFDTASDESALPRIDVFAGSLDELGVRSMRVPDETRCKASLIATVGSPGRPCLAVPNTASARHIRVAYRTDEHVEIDRLHRCRDFLDRLVVRVALTS